MINLGKVSKLTKGQFLGSIEEDDLGQMVRQPTPDATVRSKARHAAARRRAKAAQ